MDKFTRRDFLKGGAITAAAVAGAATVTALNGCTPGTTGTAAEAPKETEAWMPEKWDLETEILIIGYGFAGASAAIAANMQGADALVLEVAPEELRGGNSTACGGGWVSVWDESLYLEHLQKLCFHITPDNYLKDWVEADKGIIDWMDTLEIEHRQTVHNYSHFFTSDSVPIDPLTGNPASGAVGDSGIDQNRAIREDGEPANGKDLHDMLAQRVSDRGIRVMYETRGLALFQNPNTREVLGCRAQDKEGKDIFIKATKGVLLCCGGYENSPELIDYHVMPGLRVYPAGSPFNRGDAIYMAGPVGADLWHMAGIEWLGLGVRINDDDQSTFSDFRGLNSGCIVNKSGERMYNEDMSLIHTKEFPPIYFKGFADDPTSLCDFWGVPSFAVFDETRRLAGNAGFYVTNNRQVMGFAVNHGLYEWSDDNSKEIENGIIKRADTIRGLAEIAGINPDALEETVNNFNEYATQGLDLEYGRTEMSPIVTPPFYSIELVPTFINTQGGPKHSNLDCRCLDHDDNEIPRFYACGECGSVYSMLYHGSGNVAEAIITGKLAAENAAALEPWE
ncbi:MAG: FAD-binding protein [Coriobacteriales bacterium]|nr:FAD-binding protein [Coriobacteriales bacterium]